MTYTKFGDGLGSSKITSKTYLGLLFFHYLEHLKHIKTWNQVGFKTLRQDFEKYMVGGWNSGHTSRYTQLITMLAEGIPGNSPVEISESTSIGSVGKVGRTCGSISPP